MPKTINLNIYGAVVDQDFWDLGLATPQKVLDQIKEAGPGDQIEVHVNSPGGSVFAGQAIHNMLRQHPANVTVFVDGMAASVASVIAMAGNKIIMPPGTMMMIHNPLFSLFGAYQANAFRDMAAFLDKIKESIIATYASRCKIKTKDEINALMDATTWMTAADAVANGFADEVMETGPVAAKLSGKLLNIAGMDFDLSPFATMPTNISAASPNQTPAVAGSSPVSNAKPAANNKNIEEETILDTKELREKHPEIYNEILNAGVAQERARFKALDGVSLPGHDELLNKARYESGATAEQVAVQIINAEKVSNAKRLTDTMEDAGDVAAGGAPPPPDAKAAEAKEVQALVEKMSAMANEGRGN